MGAIYLAWRCRATRVCVSVCVCMCDVCMCVATVRVDGDEFCVPLHCNGKHPGDETLSNGAVNGPWLTDRKVRGNHVDYTKYRGSIRRQYMHG